MGLFDTGLIDLFDRDEGPAANTPFQFGPTQRLLQLLFQREGETGPPAGLLKLLEELQGTGEEFLGAKTEDRTQINFDLIKKLIQPELEAEEANLTRSFGARGLIGSGEAGTQGSNLRGKALSGSLDQALSRSFDETQQLRTLGSGILGSLPGFRNQLLQPQFNFNDLLTRLIGQLSTAGAGTAGKTFESEQQTQRSALDAVLGIIPG